MSNSAGFSSGLAIGSFDADDDSPTLDLAPADSAVVSGPGHARIRFNLSTQRLEQSISTGAWTAIATGTTAGDSLARYIVQQPNGSLPNAQSLSALGTGIVKSTTGTGILSIAIPNTDFPATTAQYLVASATAAPPNAQNLGVLTSGILQQTVSVGVATVSIKNSTALSVLGRSANSTGVPDDIQATASGQFLRRDGNNTLGFGKITTADIQDILDGLRTPKSNEFWVVLIDYDGTGNDTTGLIGIATNMASALSNAIAFKTIEKANQFIPRNGNSATLVVLIKPRTSGTVYKNIAGADQDGSWLNGLSSWHFLARGSLDFSNNTNDKIGAGFLTATGTNAAGYSIVSTVSAITIVSTDHVTSVVEPHGLANVPTWVFQNGGFTSDHVDRDFVTTGITNAGTRRILQVINANTIITDGTVTNETFNTGTPTATIRSSVRNFTCQLSGGGAPGFAAESGGFSAITGLRIRFKSTTVTTALQNICVGIIKNTTTSIKPMVALSVLPAAGDEFIIETPGITVANLTHTAGLNRTFCLVGFNATGTSTVIHRTNVSRIAGCNLTALTCSFGEQYLAAQTYVDEADVSINVGYGFRATGTPTFSSAAQLAISASSWLGPSQMSIGNNVLSSSVGSGCISVQGYRNNTTCGPGVTSIGAFGAATTHRFRVTGNTMGSSGGVHCGGLGARIFGIDSANCTSAQIALDAPNAAAGLYFLDDLVSPDGGNVGSASPNESSVIRVQGTKAHDGLTIICASSTIGAITATADRGILGDGGLRGRIEDLQRQPLVFGGIHIYGGLLYLAEWLNDAFTGPASVMETSNTGFFGNGPFPPFRVWHSRGNILNNATSPSVCEPAVADTEANCAQLMGVGLNYIWVSGDAVSLARAGSVKIEFVAGQLSTFFPGQYAYLSELGGANSGKARVGPPSTGVVVPLGPIQAVDYDTVDSPTPIYAAVNLFSQGKIFVPQEGHLSTSVLGNPLTTFSGIQDIQATASGQFLHRDGNNALVFSPITTADLPASIQQQINLSVPNKAALIAINTTTFTSGVRRFVETYKSWFTFDRDTPDRVAKADVVIAPTTGGGLWVRETQPDQYWSVQASWFIDPISGNDENEGDTSVDALKTRSEYARRTDGMPVYQNTTITIMSSLNAGDEDLPHRDGTGVPGLSGTTAKKISYIGVPIALFTGTITAYTNRNGSAAQPALITIASLPVSWTASGLVGKIIKWTDGINSIWSTVVADMGSKTAWISPPITTPAATPPVTAFSAANFTNGTSVTIYDMPSLSTTVAQALEYDYVEFSFLHATEWEFFGNYNNFFCCLGTSMATYSGTTNFQNCAMNLSQVSGIIAISGGQGRLTSTSNGNIRALLPFTLNGNGIQAISLGGNGSFEAQQAGNVACDIEVFNGASLVTATTSGPAVAIFTGFVYGTLSTANVVNFQAIVSECTVHFFQIPSLAGATTINFTTAGTTDSTANLSVREANDKYGNRVIGPVGPTLNTNRGTGITHGATASGVMDSFPIWSDVVTLVSGVSISGISASRQVIAGSGIAGGGDLSADRTFDIGTSDGTIIVAADTIRVGLITTANITANSVDNTIIRDSVATSVIGRSANSTGDPADIIAVSSGQFLRRDGSNVLGFGIITTADLPGSVTSVSGIQITAGAGLTGGGNLTANRTIDVVAADSTITVNPDSIRVNVITSGNIADNQVNNSILRDSAGNSVIGRTPNTTGDPADIIATASGQFLKRDGNNNVIFGAISLSDLPINIPGGTGVPTSRILIAGAGLTGGGDLSTDRTFDVIAADATITVNPDSIQVGAINTANINNNQVDNTKIRDSIATSVIGRSVNSTGDPADIQATASGQFLRRDGSSVLGFGSITREDLPGSVTSVSGVNITAGAGLTGGGNLTANRTIDVVAADGTIVVNPDSVQVGVIQTANINNSAVTLAKIQNIGPGHVLGNDSLSTGVVTESNVILPLILFGGELKISANGISNTLIRQSAGLSVIGRSANTTGDVADITATNATGVALVRNAGSSTLLFDKVGFTTIEPIGTSHVIGNDGGVNEEINVISPLQILGGSGELSLNATAARTFLGLDVPQTMDLILGFGTLSTDTIANHLPISEASGHSFAFWLFPITTFYDIALDPYGGNTVADTNLIADRVTEWSVAASFTRCQLSVYVYHYDPQTGTGSDFTTIKITKNGLRDATPNSLSFNTTGIVTTSIQPCSFASGDRVGVIVEPGSGVGGASNASVRFDVMMRLFK